MPKVKLSRFSEKETPPIDWLWAAILERKTVLGYDLKQLAEAGGISYDLMRRYITKSPWSWKPEVRQAICDKLGIVPLVTIKTQTEIPANTIRTKGVRS